MSGIFGGNLTDVFVFAAECLFEILWDIEGYQGTVRTEEVGKWKRAL